MPSCAVLRKTFVVMPLIKRLNVSVRHPAYSAVHELTRRLNIFYYTGLMAGRDSTLFSEKR